MLFQHGHQHVFQFLFPKLTLIKFCFHGLARGEIREAAHEKESVGVFDGNEGAEDFHSYCGVRGDGPGAEYFKELERMPGLVL